MKKVYHIITECSKLEDKYKTWLDSKGDQLKIVQEIKIHHTTKRYMQTRIDTK